MLHLFVNGEGGLTTAGYGLGAALLAAGILAACPWRTGEGSGALPSGSWLTAPWPWPWPT